MGYRPGLDYRPRLADVPRLPHDEMNIRPRGDASAERVSAGSNLWQRRQRYIQRLLQIQLEFLDSVPGWAPSEHWCDVGDQTELFRLTVRAFVMS
jgi:hypothetical protein